MKYRPEIDGLRAIAVVSVIMYHAGCPYFGGGFLGVDVFFVISGFLITKIITSELVEGTFSIINFYERRVRRILPMLFVVMASAVLVAWLVFLPSNMTAFSNSVISVATFCSNFHFWLESGYWSRGNELKPLLHTWSLAVEEQFYLVFPVLLMLTRSLKKHWTVLLMFLITMCSLGYAHWGAYNQPEANFYLLPSRIWELAIGAFIAQVMVYYPEIIKRVTAYRLVNELLGLGGLFLIAYSVLFYHDRFPLPSMYSLLPTVGSGLVIVFASPSTVGGRVLGIKLMVQIGLVSYSAYLWHQPLFAFVKYVAFPAPSVWLMTILTVGVFPLSYLSWNFIETPFRNREWLSQSKVFCSSLVGSLAFVIFGIIGLQTEGFKDRSSVEKLKIRNYQPDNVAMQRKSWQKVRSKVHDESYGLYQNPHDDQLWFSEQGTRKKLLLVGDSHSKDLYNTLGSTIRLKKHYQIARYGVRIKRLNHTGYRMFSSPNYKSSDIVMLCARYKDEDLEVMEALVKRMMDDHKQVVIVKNIVEFQTSIIKTFADHYIQENLVGKPAVTDSMANVAVQAINKAYYKEYLDEKSKKRDSDIVIDELGAKYREILVLDRMDYICEDAEQSCFAINDQLEKYFYDYGHNTVEGAAYFGERIDKVGWLDKL